MANALQTIEELERPTAEQFQRHAPGSRPVLIRGAAGNWQALTRWTPDYLASKSGNAEVPVWKLGKGSASGQFFDGKDDFTTEKFSECLGLLTGAPPRVYMANVSIGNHLPALAGDVGRLEFIGDRKQRPQMWIGGKGSKGPLHYDLENNIHVVVSGRKRFLMFEHSQRRNLYSFSALSATPNFSPVDAANPDVDRFPRFKQARGYDVTLNPGDMIYIPVGCWHQVITEEPSVAINFWLDKRLLHRSTTRIYFAFSRALLRAFISSPWRAMRGRHVSGE